MGLIIKVKEDMFALTEKMMHYRFRDKERERSNRAAKIARELRGSYRRCPSFPPHDVVVWSGPPHDAIQAWVCRFCGAVASEPEIKDRGVDFSAATSELIEEIMDLDLQRQGNAMQFTTGGLAVPPR